MENNQSIEQKVKEDVKVIVGLANEKSDKLYAWYKQVLLMASGLLSILIALHSKKSECCLEHISFVTAVVSLAVGILVGSIFLFSQVDNIARAQKEYAEKASQRLREKSQGSIIVSGTTSKVFVICEIVSYVSFLIALASLCVYAVLSDRM